MKKYLLLAIIAICHVSQTGAMAKTHDQQVASVEQKSMTREEIQAAQIKLIQASIELQAKSVEQIYSPTNYMAWAVRATLAAALAYAGVQGVKKLRPELIQKLQKAPGVATLQKVAQEGTKIVNTVNLSIQQAPMGSFVLSIGSSMAVNALAPSAIEELQKVLPLKSSQPHSVVRNKVIYELYEYLHKTTDLGQAGQGLISGYIRSLKSDDELKANGNKCIAYCIQNSLHVAAFIKYYHDKIGNADVPQKKDVRAACIQGLIELMNILKNLQQEENCGEILAQMVQAEQESVKLLDALQLSLINTINMFMEHAI